MNPKHVITIILRSNGSVLILKRSRKAGTYGGKWESVGGDVEGASSLMLATRKIREETGLQGGEVKFLKAGREFEVKDRQQRTAWIVHPFLFEAFFPKNVRVAGGHSEFKWIKPADLELFETVPGLDQAMSHVL
ncbi:MAG: NUDIX domain-containing protein [Pseudomonadota bacterium]